MRFADLPAMLFADERPKTKADYANLSDRELFRLISINESGQEAADTDHEWFVCTENLRALHAVRAERRF